MAYISLIPVTKKIMEGIAITAEVDCFALCDILRLKIIWLC